MKEIISAPITAAEYDSADKILRKLMQPQVRQMMNSVPVEKKKSKSPPRGSNNLPKEFLRRPIPGQDPSTNLQSLSPFTEDGVLYTKGRFGKHLKRILGTEKLPILPPTCELAKHIMTQAHKMANMGGSDTCARSRQDAWIVRARRLANRIAFECLECRI